MHVDETLRAPDPIVFGVLLFFGVEGAAGEVGAVRRDADIVPVLDGVFPLYSREVDAPAISGQRGAVSVKVILFEFGPGKGEVGFPTLVFLGGVVEGAVDEDFFL